MDIGFNIEAPDSFTAEEGRKAIVSILKSDADPIAICAALLTLKSMCSTNAMISGCVASGEDKTS